MNFDRIFRSLFGFPDTRSGNNPPEFGQEPPSNHPDYHQSDGFFFSGSFPNGGEPNFQFRFFPGPGFPGHGFHPPGRGGDDDGDDDDDDDGGHGAPFPGGFPGFPSGSDPFNMMRQFEEVFKGFDDMFRGFGVQDIPQHAVPSIQLPPPAQGSLRDQMLKEPDSNSSNSSIRDGQKPDSQLQIPSSDPPRLYPDVPGESNSERWFNSIIGRLWSSPKQDWTAKPTPKEDSDLDQEILRGNFEALRPGGSSADRDHVTPNATPNMPGGGAGMEPSSHYQGVSVYTFRSADGRLEERRTYQDGYGNKEETVTRGVGDQSHTVTIRRTPSGNEERKEDYQNMQESDKDNFERHWETPEIVLPIDRSRSPSQRPRSNTPSDSNSSTASMFKNLFGFHFPGFPKADR